METLPNTTEAWIWWVVSTIIVGLLINLLASYLYPKLDQRLAMYSEQRRHSLAVKEREFREQVDKLLASSANVTDAKIEMIHSQLWAILYLAGGIFITTFLPELLILMRLQEIAIIIFFGICLLTASAVLRKLNEIRYLSSLLDAAKSNIDTLDA